jgi:hypothetical protein
MSLDDYSDSDIEMEMERRKELRTRAPEPIAIELTEWDMVMNGCINYIEALKSGNHHTDDIEHYIFERALEAIFGKDVWEWVNERLR